MTEGPSKEFFAVYHAAVFGSLGDNAAVHNAKVGVYLANAWLRGTKDPPATAESFKAAIESYMGGVFRFSDSVELDFGPGGSASLHVKGCTICNGNEVLRGEGKKGSCPISQFLKSAMGKSLKKSVELTGVDKPGPVGECYLRYKVL